jgi:hypothetical protein
VRHSGLPQGWWGQDRCSPNRKSHEELAMHFPGFFSVEPQGQAVLQLGELTLALILSSLTLSGGSMSVLQTESMTWAALSLRYPQ